MTTEVRTTLFKDGVEEDLDLVVQEVVPFERPQQILGKLLIPQVLNGIVTNSTAATLCSLMISMILVSSVKFRLKFTISSSFSLAFPKHFCEVPSMLSSIWHSGSVVSSPLSISGRYCSSSPMIGESLMSNSLSSLMLAASKLSFISML